MNKKLRAYEEISAELINNNVSFNVSCNDCLYIITDKATLTIQKTGACILKTNSYNAKAILDENKSSSTRVIWTGDVVSNYSFKNINKIADDIMKI
ncbi:hypothetical protein [Clostridium neonatale]|uniref:hypothetical protein n=1 Tax=Clostridium neonatale TaxID=137838 RepID=UPI00291BE09E|nr:hypothetical protein [Clostridium neonatale]CAI3202360.1 hypothetical protein CNEO2_350001 [Clostridium neonatale]CAI3211150.1 hypothetical protein CNEO2_480001 [Clostridium neonatale]